MTRMYQKIENFPVSIECQQTIITTIFLWAAQMRYQPIRKLAPSLWKALGQNTHKLYKITIKQQPNQHLNTFPRTM